MNATERHTPQHFEEMFEASDDPWRFRSSWYEARKRALTLACLPRARYASGYEPGCANGELSAALAARCERLLVSDGALGAAQAARARLADMPQVEVIEAWLPEQWPAGRFDLVVVSEVAYYLGAAALAGFAAKLRASLDPGATVLACHWRHPIEGCAFTGDEVHRRLGEGLALPRIGQVVEADLRIDVWCEDSRSVAQCEGLV